MLYSVWNNSSKTYTIYESSFLPIPKFLQSNPLGSTPEDTNESLPSDSIAVGTSNIASGKIVDGPTLSFKQIAIYGGIIWLLGYIFKR